MFYASKVRRNRRNRRNTTNLQNQWSSHWLMGSWTAKTRRSNQTQTKPNTEQTLKSQTFQNKQKICKHGVTSDSVGLPILRARAGPRLASQALWSPPLKRSRPLRPGGIWSSNLWGYLHIFGYPNMWILILQMRINTNRCFVFEGARWWDKQCIKQHNPQY